MHFKHCPDCGALLTARDLGDEKDVPWCQKCSKPWFDVFPLAIIALVYNRRGQVLLLRQGYISTEFANLVSGYVQPGESCEECAVREIYEETGQRVEQLTPVTTKWFAAKEMMMAGYFASVGDDPLRLSGEVDSASWHTPAEALGLVHQSPASTSRLLVQAFIDYLSPERQPMG